MVEKIIAIHERYPYHYQIEQDHVRVVFLLGPSLNMDAMDFIEGLGFKLEKQFEVGKAKSSPGNYVQMEYFFRYKLIELPKKEQELIIKLMESNSYQRRLLIQEENDRKNIEKFT